MKGELKGRREVAERSKCPHFKQWHETDTGWCDQRHNRYFACGCLAQARRELEEEKEKNAQ